MEGFEDRALEREIVAALESVFPRVGLRTFVTLVEEDKVTQVQELASIVFGIRLFNREIGKGGTGITDVPATLRSALGSLGEDLIEQHEKISKACENYTLTINYMHRQQDSKGVPPRLRDELTNRRQYLACLHNLQEDCSTLRQRAEESVGAYNEVLEELQGIVGSKSSVPKEQVYPKFDRLAKVWKEMEEDLGQVEARLRVLETLLKFKQSFHTRLRAHDVAAARASLSDDPGLVAAVAAESEALAEMAEMAAEGVQLDEPLSPTMEPEEPSPSPGEPEQAQPEHEVPSPEPEVAPGVEAPAEAEAAPEVAVAEAAPAEAEAALEAAAEAAPAAADAPAEEAAEVPVVEESVVVRTTATGSRVGPGGATAHLYDVWRQRHSVGQLAMGKFCPWTVAHRDSLLLFGRAPHGVIEYKGAFYAFATGEALEASLKGMEGLLEKVYLMARRQPELIHLLQLGGIFPSASLPAIVEASVGTQGAQGVVMCDSDCQTPTHFYASNVDPKYEWNEWSLRRRGLQLVNLRSKRTHSTQTTSSHFRRENEVQTYEHKERETNTLKDAKTQAPKTISYMTGLRGRPTKQFNVVAMTLE